MSVSNSVATLTRSEASVTLLGYSHLALVTPDLKAARDFYCGILGLTAVGSDLLPDCGAHLACATASGQTVALCEIGRAHV